MSGSAFSALRFDDSDSSDSDFDGADAGSGSDDDVLVEDADELREEAADLKVERLELLGADALPGRRSEQPARSLLGAEAQSCAGAWGESSDEEDWVPGGGSEGEGEGEEDEEAEPTLEEREELKEDVSFVTQEKVSFFDVVTGRKPVSATPATPKRKQAIKAGKKLRKESTQAGDSDSDDEEWTPSEKVDDGDDELVLTRSDVKDLIEDTLFVQAEVAATPQTAARTQNTDSSPPNACTGVTALEALDSESSGCTNGFEGVSIFKKLMLSESAEEVQRLVKSICSELSEINVDKVQRCVDVFGCQAARETLAETKAIEAKGGQLVADGSRNKSAGGVFFDTLQKNMGKKGAEQMRTIVIANNKWRKQGAKQKSKAGAKSSAPSKSLAKRKSSKGPLGELAKRTKTGVK
jgi:hypothetical protein